MGFRRFSFQLSLRIAFLTLALAAWVYLFMLPGYPTIHFLLTVMVAIQIVEIFRLVSRTNAELTRFLDALRYSDFGQRFQMPKVGAGFEELGSAFTEIIDRFKAERVHREEDLRHLRALTEHVPLPLLSLHPDGRIKLHNNSARRLFGNARISRLKDLLPFGEDFSKQVLAVEAGERRLATFHLDNLEQKLTISATEIVIASKMEKLISLNNIQSELDGAQLQAWQDLVRVLTHEIMNSITPVASLAKTAAELVDDAIEKLKSHPDIVEDLVDVKSAVETVSRRSDGLRDFVQSYRRITRLPQPEEQRIPLLELFDNVQRLVASEWEKKGIALSMTVEPKSLEITADSGMLEQVMFNLLQNAEQVLADRESPRVEVVGNLNRQGHACVEISDNGPGVPADVAKKVFVPFFTTKREGSGVGLALTRQVMLAHGGTVTLGASESGGAKFTLTFLANRA